MDVDVLEFKMGVAPPLREERASIVIVSPIQCPKVPNNIVLPSAYI